VGVRPRRIFVPGAFYDRVYLKAGWMSPVILEQGRAVGIWEAKKGPRKITVTVVPFAPLSPATLRAVRAEAERLAPFLGGGTVELSGPERY
jgi:hypothetical protein